MKIILAHKFFHMTGGTEKYFRDLTNLLEQNGHHTIPFALHNPKNPETPYSKYFLDDLDYHQSSFKYRVQNLSRIFGRTLYSWEARRKIETLIRENEPNLAHIQSIEHHISPSILHSLKKYNIPIIQSVNTYKLVCASYRLYLRSRAEICQRCLFGKHYHAALTQCVKDSLPASMLAMVEMYLHDAMKIYHLVDRFIVPNTFISRLLQDAGYPAYKITKLLNPMVLDEYKIFDSFGDYILYFGRIDPEKGVMTLVQAMSQIPKMKLIIVGSGSQLGDIEKWILDNGAENIEIAGPKWGEELTPYLAGARLVVVPSVWHEPSPYVIYQSLASGKPVIGANIGGIPDLITEETGYLFEPGNVMDLVEKLSAAVFDDKRLHTMGRAARNWAEENFDPERYYKDLMRLYTQVIEEKQA